MKVTTVLSMIADRARMLSRPAPVIRTDEVSARMIADAISDETSGYFSPGPLPADTYTMYDGVRVMAGQPKPTFEIGKRYRMRDGRITKPLERRAHNVYPFVAMIPRDEVERTWTENGQYTLSVANCELDLMPGAIGEEEAFYEGAQWKVDHSAAQQIEILQLRQERNALQSHVINLQSELGVSRCEAQALRETIGSTSLEKERDAALAREDQAQKAADRYKRERDEARRDCDELVRAVNSCTDDVIAERKANQSLRMRIDAMVEKPKSVTIDGGQTARITIKNNSVGPMEVELL